ncbi:hypothetical protein VPH35_094094 [Triticum aestivum]
MGVSDAMQWWDEWKLRVLVLCSLSVQFFLYFSGWVRLVAKLRRLRVLVWMAHIGGDALAQRTADEGSDALELIWVPILLIHLGGQSSSAYSLEDNELWKRHAITLWWSGQKKLLQAAVLLFVSGILKFSEKPWALKRASFNSIASESLSKRREKASMPPCWAWCTSDFWDITSALQKKKEEHQCNLSLQDYVDQAKKSVQGGTEVVASESDNKTVIVSVFRHVSDYISMMVVDLSIRYSVRLNYLQYFLKLDDQESHQYLRLLITSAYGLMYSKQKSAQTCLGCSSELLIPFLPLASLVLFAKSDKDGYNDKDITVTYILLCCTVVIQLLPILIVPCFLWALNYIALSQDMVSQHNLISFCARKKKPTTLMKLAAFKCLRDYLNKHWYNWQVPAAPQIEVLIRQYVLEDGWKEFIHGPTTYRRFNNLWGQRSLSRHPQLGQQLGWSLDLPFDEIVLVWHIATDLCFHHPNTSSQVQNEDTTQRSTQISNYMIHLLFMCPEMLMPGTRQDLFTVACDDIKHILRDQNDPPSIAHGILQMQQDGDEHGGEMVPKAQKLAKELMDHLDEEQRWTVIQGVWVEMLCYSASRCRGYLHAKSLGEGGEFLTNVWFLWSLMGMEILGDKIHIPSHPLGEEEITGAPV